MRCILVLGMLAACGRLNFDVRGTDDARSLDALDPDTSIVGAWSMAQVTGSSNGTAPVAPIESGSLVVVAVQLGIADTVTNVSDNTPGGSNSYVAVPGATASDSNTAARVEIWYAASSRPGATSVAVSSPSTGVTIVWEVRWPMPIVVDAASVLSSQPVTAEPLGAAVTTTTAGTFIVSVAVADNNVIGIHAGNPFTNDMQTNGNGWAHITSASSPAGTHQAHWDQDVAGTYCSATAAFRAGPR